MVLQVLNCCWSSAIWRLCNQAFSMMITIKQLHQWTQEMGGPMVISNPNNVVRWINTHGFGWVQGGRALFQRHLLALPSTLRDLRGYWGGPSKTDLKHSETPNLRRYNIWKTGVTRVGHFLSQGLLRRKIHHQIYQFQVLPSHWKTTQTQIFNDVILARRDGLYGGHH